MILKTSEMKDFVAIFPKYALLCRLQAERAAEVMRGSELDTRIAVHLAVSQANIIIIIILITRPKPAYGRQGLAGGSLCAFGAQLGSGK